MNKIIALAVLAVVAVFAVAVSAQVVTTYGYPNTWSGYRVHYEVPSANYLRYNYNYNNVYPYSSYVYSPYSSAYYPSYYNGAYLNTVPAVWYKK